MDPVTGIVGCLFTTEPLAQRFSHGGSVFGMDAILPEARLFQQLVHGMPPDALEGRTDIREPVGFEFPEPEHVADAFDEKAESGVVGRSRVLHDTRAVTSGWPRQQAPLSFTIGQTSGRSGSGGADWIDSDRSMLRPLTDDVRSGFLCVLFAR